MDATSGIHAAHSRPLAGHEAAWRLYVDLALVASMRCPR